MAGEQGHRDTGAAVFLALALQRGKALLKMSRGILLICCRQGGTWAPCQSPCPMADQGGSGTGIQSGHSVLHPWGLYKAAEASLNAGD